VWGFAPPGTEVVWEKGGGLEGEDGKGLTKYRFGAKSFDHTVSMQTASAASRILCLRERSEHHVPERSEDYRLPRAERAVLSFFASEASIMSLSVAKTIVSRERSEPYSLSSRAKRASYP
jgi:hypothetical protein